MTTSSNIENRVTRLEVRVDGHDQDFKEVRAEQADIGETLKSVVTNLTQIKWFAIGGTIAYMAAKLGLLEVLKALIL